MDQQQKHFKYLDIITVFFVAVLIISNIASSKITKLGPFSFDAGTILFPLSYIFGDILTEVYGYARARRVIWLGFGATLLMGVVFIIVGKLPPAPDWTFQNDYMNILGLTPRIVAASLIAFFAGSFSNSFVLAKAKILTKGRYLWIRTIGSTLVGEGIDTLLFVAIAFLGVFPASLFWTLVISNYIFKVLVEIAFTPITYKIVGALKKTEHEDYYDAKTNFNPFKTKA